jgi:hypothetical protein
MSHINYNHLYYFWHVCKQGSIVNAAEKLFLTPQTITGQIKALEERLQGKLFRRQGRGVAPTLYGQEIYSDGAVREVGRLEEVKEEYYVIFAERMIQHPAVQRICNHNFAALFAE